MDDLLKMLASMKQADELLKNYQAQAARTGKLLREVNELADTLIDRPLDELIELRCKLNEPFSLLVTAHTMFNVKIEQIIKEIKDE